MERDIGEESLRVDGMFRLAGVKCYLLPGACLGALEDREESRPRFARP